MTLLFVDIASLVPRGPGRERWPGPRRWSVVRRALEKCVRSRGISAGSRRTGPSTRGHQRAQTERVVLEPVDELRSHRLVGVRNAPVRGSGNRWMRTIALRTSLLHRVSHRISTNVGSSAVRVEAFAHKNGTYRTTDSTNLLPPDSPNQVIERRFLSPPHLPFHYTRGDWYR